MSAWTKLLDKPKEACYNKCMKTKVCTKCGRELSLIKFSLHSFTKDRRQSYCRECGIGLHKKWCQNHREIVNACNKRWRDKRPWFTHYLSADLRCNNPRHKTYKYYGGRGIKLLMNIADFGKLWFRDKAYLLKQPSIDRKNSDGDYTFKNCRFIELTDNVVR